MTIFYNFIEGIVSVLFGVRDETIALSGFGLDSFVEVISGIGIWHMIRRLRGNNDTNSDRFEIQALRITGVSFYILTTGLTIAATINLIHKNKPETTLWGIVIALVSIFSMWLLIHYKLKVGRKLNSHAIIADAHCTRACMYLSFILLLSSIGYEITGVGGLDSIGAILIAWLSFREGREAFQKAKGKKVCSCAENCR
ncbi:MAG: cation transporter [Nitrospirae bacterium]|nr:cation transporter [Nitrospirota bacterium]